MKFYLSPFSKIRTHTLCFIAGAILLSCSSQSFKVSNDETKENISHYIWSSTLVAPAISSAMGPLDENSVKAIAAGLPEEEQSQLIEISGQAFTPEKVYGKLHQASLLNNSKEDMLSFAHRLETPAWQKFSENLLYYYSQEGSEEVARVMRELDQEEFILEMDKAIIAEKLSQNSYNFKTIDILFSKMPGGSKVESLLYRTSLFVTTYLAVEDLEMEELKELQMVRDEKMYQKYKLAFESVVSSQYDEFLSSLERIAQTADI